jgi:hypothetical protein
MHLVSQLKDLRAQRTELDKREQETIGLIKQKFQEQKQILKQIEQELRLLGITCSDEDTGARPARGE